MADKKMAAISDLNTFVSTYLIELNLSELAETFCTRLERGGIHYDMLHSLKEWMKVYDCYLSFEKSKLRRMQESPEFPLDYQNLNRLVVFYLTELGLREAATAFENRTLNEADQYDHTLLDSVRTWVIPFSALNSSVNPRPASTSSSAPLLSSSSMAAVPSDTSSAPLLSSSSMSALPSKDDLLPPIQWPKLPYLPPISELDQDLHPSSFPSFEKYSQMQWRKLSSLPPAEANTVPQNPQPEQLSLPSDDVFYETVIYEDYDCLTPLESTRDILPELFEEQYMQPQSPPLVVSPQSPPPAVSPQSPQSPLAPLAESPQSPLLPQTLQTESPLPQPSSGHASAVIERMSENIVPERSAEENAGVSSSDQNPRRESSTEKKSGGDPSAEMKSGDDGNGDK